MAAEEARQYAAQLIADPARALETLTREELGLNPGELGSPWGAALASFVAFALGGAGPLAAHLLAPGPHALTLSKHPALHAFAAEMTEQLGVEVVPVSSTEDAISGADVVMCATNSIEAIFFQQWMEPGMHVSSIKMPEIDQAALERADRVGLHFGHQSPDVVAARGVEAEDHRPGLGWQASKGFDFSKSPKLPEMLAGAARGRQRDDEITCFINDLGLGLQFAAVAGVGWRKAKDAGVGHELPTDWFTETVHP